MAALILTLCAMPPSADAQGCALKELATLRTETTEDGGVLLPTQFERQVRFLLLDTGGITSTMRPDVAQALGVPPRDASFGITGLGRTPSARAIVLDWAGNPLDRRATLPSLQLGPISTKEHDFLLYDPGFPDGRVAGTLGTELLEGYDLELDPDGNRVGFFSQDHCKGAVVYWSSKHIEIPFILEGSPRPKQIVIPVSLDGVPLKAMIDTGSMGSILRAATARRLFGLTAGSPGVEEVGSGTGPGGRRVSILTYQFKRMTAHGLVVLEPNMSLLPLRNPGEEGGGIFHRRGVREDWDVIIGMDVLQYLHLFIAYGEQTIYATKAEAH